MSTWLAALTCATAVIAQPATSTESYTYDALGRLIGQVSDGTVNDNNVRTYCYDRAGNRTLVVSDQTGALSTNACPASVFTTSNLWIEDVAVTEGGVLAFTITRSGSTAVSVSVAYATSNGTAIAPADYTASSGTVSFAAGETTKVVNVATIDDSLFEPNKTVNFTLTNPVGAVLADGVGIGTINDNDAGLAVYISVSDGQAAEGSPVNFSVTRTGNTSSASSFGYYTQSITALSNDYTSVSATLSFAPGEVSKIICVPTTSDTNGEFFEEFQLTLRDPSPNTIFNGGLIRGTIIDDDLTALLSVGDVTATEGGNLSFVVTRSGRTDNAVTAEYETLNGTASAPGDFAAATGTISFAAGQTSRTVVVPTVDESAVEGTETMTLFMPFRSPGAHILDGSGIGTILDNDSNPGATLSIANASVTEGGSLSFVVTRGGNTAIAASASYTTSNGTAAAPGDYTAGSGTVSFTAGQTSRTITVATVDDTAVESAETLTVTMSAPSANVTISNATATGTINDNDVAPATITVSDTTVAEGGVLNFVVTRGGNTASSVSVSFVTSDGTAVAPGDYTSSSGTVSFAGGETSKSVLVQTSSDSLVDPAEIVNLTLSGQSSGVIITDGAAAGTINDVQSTTIVLTTGGSAPLVGSVLSAHSSTYACSSGSIPGGGTQVQCFTFISGTVYQARTGIAPRFAPGYSLNASGALQVAQGSYGQGGPLN